MSALTTRLSLYKPGGGSTGTITPDETADIDKINEDLDLIDEAVGAVICTSGTRPSTPYDGKIIYETDTSRFHTWRSATSAWVAGATTRGALTDYLVADLTALDAISDATLGDSAWMTAPGTGINPIRWVAWAGSGATIDWRPDSTQLVVSDTKAHLDTFIAAVAAISDTRFEVGTYARALDTAFLFQFTTDVGAYKRFTGALALIPTIAGTGGTSARDAVSGEVTFSGALTVLDVYIPTADIAMLSAAKYVDITIGYTGSTVGTQIMQLLDGAGAVDATASSYFADYAGQAGGAAVNDNRAASTSWATMSAASRRRRFHTYRARNLAAAEFTEVVGTCSESDTGTTNRLVVTAGLVHEVAGIKAGVRITLAGLGTLSKGQITMEAHY